VRPLEHFFESRGFRPGEMTVLSTTPVLGMYVVLMRLIGPNGPWDYAVQTYFADGSRVPGGCWQGPSLESAQQVVEDVVTGWRNKGRIPSAAELVDAWRAKHREAS
jgi:hypothetical protein